MEWCHMRWGRRSGACKGAEHLWQALSRMIRRMRRFGEGSSCASTALVMPRGSSPSRTLSCETPPRCVPAADHGNALT